MGLVEKFIEERKNNQEGDSLLGEDLNQEKEFQDYLFKVYLLGYVKKTIAFSSMEIKKRAKEMSYREEANLNIVDIDFNEERINLIKDNKEDFTEDLWLVRENENAYCEITHDQDIINAISSLTPRQREIIYRCIIVGERDTDIAKKLGITKQGVNKTKILALNKLKKILKNKQEMKYEE